MLQILHGTKVKWLLAVATLFVASLVNVTCSTNGGTTTGVIFHNGVWRGGIWCDGADSSEEPPGAHCGGESVEENPGVSVTCRDGDGNVIAVLSCNA